MNAYDTPDGGVVIDLCDYDRMFDRDILGPFGDGGMARLERWELDPQRRTASITVIDDTSNEFPRHRGSLTASPYRYGYCASPSTRSEQGLADTQARPADRRALGVRARPGPRRRRAGVRRPPGRHRGGRRLAGDVRPRPRRRARPSSWSSTPRTSAAATSPACRCPNVCRSASTATGSATGRLLRLPDRDVTIGGCSAQERKPPTSNCPTRTASRCASATSPASGCCCGGTPRPPRLVERFKVRAFVTRPIASTSSMPSSSARRSTRPPRTSPSPRIRTSRTACSAMSTGRSERSTRWSATRATSTPRTPGATHS